MDPEKRYREARKAVFVGVFGNLLLSLFKLFAGIMGNSLAVVADAVHSISDILTSVVVWLGLRFGKKPLTATIPMATGTWSR